MNARKLITASAVTILFAAGTAFAQDATTTLPGTPNTGSGGSATANMILLSGSAAVALAGASYLITRRRTL